MPRSAKGPKSGADWIAELESSDDRVAHHARLFLGGLGPTESWMLGDFAQAACSSDSYLRFWAVVALKRLGDAARPASPVLEALVVDETPSIRALAAECLWDVLDPASAFATLRDIATSDEHDEPRRCACRELGKTPAELSAEAVTTLAPLLADPVVAGEAATGIKLLLIACNGAPPGVDVEALTLALRAAKNGSDERCAIQAKAALRRIDKR